VPCYQAPKHLTLSRVDIDGLAFQTSQPTTEQTIAIFQTSSQTVEGKFEHQALWSYKQAASLVDPYLLLTLASSLHLHHSAAHNTDYKLSPYIKLSLHQQQ